jgi:hypothetical protein
MFPNERILPTHAPGSRFSEWAYLVSVPSGLSISGAKLLNGGWGLYISYGYGGIYQQFGDLLAEGDGASEIPILADFELYVGPDPAPEPSALALLAFGLLALCRVKVRRPAVDKLLS